MVKTITIDYTRLNTGMLVSDKLNTELSEERGRQDS